MKTVFPKKFGCPRQGVLAPNTRGIINVQKKLKLSITDLNQFSHIWVIWDFNQNTNKRTVLRVKPPRLQGKKYLVPGALKLQNLVNYYRNSITKMFFWVGI